MMRKHIIEVYVRVYVCLFVCDIVFTVVPDSPPGDLAWKIIQTRYQLHLNTHITAMNNRVLQDVINLCHYMDITLWAWGVKVQAVPEFNWTRVFRRFLVHKWLYCILALRLYITILTSKDLKSSYWILYPM